MNPLARDRLLVPGLMPPYDTPLPHIEASLPCPL
jgi:hypothetical protein